jgi:hypothetical protein
MLTALGASNALAWQATITAPLDCTYVYVTSHDTDDSFRNHPSGDLIFKQAGHSDLTKKYTFDTTSSNKNQVILKLSQSELGLGSGTVELGGDSSVKTSFKILAPITIGTPSRSADKVTWPVHNPNTSSPVNFLYQLKEDSAQKGNGSVAANSDVTPPITTTVVTGTGITVNTLLLTTVSTSGTPCVQQKVLSLETKPAASASASASPAASASPSESAAATTEPTSSAVPSPPNTGGGSSGGADRSFAFVLLALVLGTVGVGGTILALSRKGS